MPARSFHVAAASVLLVVAASLTGCVPGADPADTDATQATVTAEKSGFQIAVHGVSITAPEGATEAGTTVMLDTIDAPIPTDVSGFTSPTGTSIALTLEGKQPELPLEATFDIPEDVDPDTVFVLGSDPTTGTGVAFVESTIDPDQSKVIAEITHLSWFTPVIVDKDSFSEQLRDWIDQSMGTASETPDCYGNDTELQFSAVRDNIAWPCATETATGAEWSLQSNSGLVWQVLTEPTAEYDPITSLSVAGITTAAVYDRIKNSLQGDSVLLPLETLSAKFTEPAPYTIALKVEPGLSQVATIMWGLSMIFPKKWVDIASNAECVVGVVKSAIASISGETLRTILSCVASALQGAGADILGILLTGPGLLATQLQGIAREIMQTNTVQFTLGYNNPNHVDTLPEGAAWLFDLPQEIVKNPGEPEDAIITTDGNALSFPNSTNVWVGCDEDTHVTTFYLDGNYTELSIALALNDFTPDGLTATVQIGSIQDKSNHGLDFIGERDLTAEWTLPPGTITDREVIDVTGLWFIAFYTHTDDPCTVEDTGYLALLDTYVQ